MAPVQSTASWIKRMLLHVEQ